MIDSTKSEHWKAGYKYGESMNLNNVPKAPDGLNGEQLRQWYAGLDAAISDRLS